MATALRHLALALLCAGALLVPAATAGASAPDDFFGVVWDRGITEANGLDKQAQWNQMGESGVETVRTVFHWDTTQPKVDELNWTEPDRLVGLAATQDISLLPVVLGTPDWASDTPGLYGSTPRDPRDYAAFMRALVERYGPAGAFWDERPELPRRPVRTWQIWNEPHLRFHWETEGRRPGAWAGEYARLLRAAYPAVKQADRGATVVLAGLADFAWKHLKRLNRHRIRGHFDVAALNFFTSTPRRVLKGMRLFRRAMARGREQRVPLWLTETTWPAGQGRVPVPATSWQKGWYTTDTGMAQRLTRFYRLALRARRKLRLQRVYWYTWSSSYKQDDLFDYAGLVRFPSGDDGIGLTPALDAFVRIVRAN